MRKHVAIVALALMLTFMVSCSDKNDSSEEGSSNLDTAENIAATDPSASTDDDQTQPPKQAIQRQKDVRFDTDKEVDPTPLDLTDLNSVMAYAVLFDTVSSASDHIGRQISLTGTYYAEYYSEPDAYYHHVVVSDEQACCSLGLELTWSGEHRYPDDYPEYGSTITVTGTFGYYLVNDQPVYCLLAEGNPLT